MKVLVTGYNGQLGYDVVKRLIALNIDCLGTERKDFNLTDEKETKEFIMNYNPDVVVHCAAYTAVDRAEDEKEICYDINVNGTRYIAEVCKVIDAKMVYISTDYVFDGEGTEPFAEHDIPKPINYYGQTKFGGELEVQKNLDKYFIIRISWVFGSNGNNFVKTMLRLGKELNEINVVADQIGSPTYTYDVAILISEMLQTGEYGIYHATNEGHCSWYEFACEIFRQSRMDVKVNPINTEEYPTRAKRPRNSRLSKDKLETEGFGKMRGWEGALVKYMCKEGRTND